MTNRILSLLSTVLLASSIAVTADAAERWPQLLSQLRDQARLEPKNAAKVVLYLRGGQTLRGAVIDLRADVVAIEAEKAVIWVELAAIAALGVDPAEQAFVSADFDPKEMGAELSRVLAPRGVRVTFEIDRVESEAERRSAVRVMREAAQALSAIAENELGKSAVSKVRRVSIGTGAQKISLQGDRLSINGSPSAAEIQKILERSL